MVKSYIAKIYFLVSIGFVWCGIVTAQTVKVSGYIKDSKTGEKLIGASVYDSIHKIGAYTNEYGYFSLQCKAHTKLIVSYIGYSERIVPVHSSDTVLTIKLAEQSVVIHNVTVIANKSGLNQMGEFVLSAQQIKQTPILLGEKDVVKALQFTPGIQANQEGATGFSVRGGSHDQNLFMLDGVPVYNINHLFGFFSVFSADAVSHCTFYKSHIPAQYSGRLSSVADIRLREGNNDKIHGLVSIGLISSSLSLEGPLKKDTSTFYFSARRTYFDLFSSSIMYLQTSNFFGYYFQDFTLKTNYKLDSVNTLYLSLYGGNDNLYYGYNYTYEGYTNKSWYNLGWGNLISAVRWNKVLPNQKFSNVTLYNSYYGYNVGTTKSTKHKASNTLTEERGTKYLSKVNDVGAKWDIDVFTYPKHSIKLGVESILHKYNPGQNRYTFKDERVDNSYNTVNGETLFTGDLGLYLQDKYTVNSYVTVQGGLRQSTFITNNKTFVTLQPRFLALFHITPKIRANVTYSRMVQPVHLLLNSNVGTPTDLWVPIMKQLPPENSNQLSVGFAFDLPQNTKFSVDAYYKKMNNLLELRPYAIINFKSGNWPDFVFVGTGKAKGIEFQLAKSQGKYTFAFNYTLAQSVRTFNGINQGKEFPFKYGSTHSASSLVTYKFNDNKSISAAWVYNDGYYMSLPKEKYTLFYNGNEVTVVNNDKKNNFKSPAFHHLDISYTSKKKKKRGIHEWNYGIYNVYNRANPFMISLWKNYDESQYSLDMMSAFQLIPFISWNYEF